MPILNITGQDTLVLNSVVITDFAEGTVSNLTFPNEIAKSKTGKNGNSIIAQDYQGYNADLVLRIMRASSDDINLNSQLTQMLANFPGFVTISGQFVKQLGDGQGNTVNDIYNLGGGFFTKQVEVETNAEGGTDQSVSVYHMKFVNVTRTQA